MTMGKSRPGYDDCPRSRLAAFCGQHPLHHVLVRAVCSHGDEGRSQKGCPYRVFLTQDMGALLEEVQAFLGAPREEFPVVPSVHGG